MAHGLIRQSSRFLSHRSPVNPARQRHFNWDAKPSASSHKPPFLHGDLETQQEIHEELQNKRSVITSGS